MSIYIVKPYCRIYLARLGSTICLDPIVLDSGEIVTLLEINTAHEMSQKTYMKPEYGLSSSGLMAFTCMTGDAQIGWQWSPEWLQKMKQIA